MYLIIEENNSVYKAEALDCYIQERVILGEIDVIDCETMKISNGYGFDDLPEYYDE